MSINVELYTIFNKEGRILQVEYGLEAVNNSLPLVVLKNSDTIICASKKYQGDALEDETHTSFQPIYVNVYSAFTGLWSDVYYINSEAKNLAHSLSYELGFPVTPDILCRSLADKQQVKIQSVGDRPLAFGGCLFGFDKNKPVISMTNISAICYPVYGVAVGEKHNKMSQYIEKHYDETHDDKKLFEVAVGSLLESIGENSVYQEIEVSFLKQDQALQYMSDPEVEQLLLKIAEQ